MGDSSQMPLPGGALLCYELPVFVWEGYMEPEDPAVAAAVAAYSAKVNRHVPVSALEAWDGGARKGQPGDFEAGSRPRRKAEEEEFPDEQHWDDGPEAASDEEPEDDEEEEEPSGEDLGQDDDVPRPMVRNQPRNPGYQSVLFTSQDGEAMEEDEPPCMHMRLVDYFGDTDPVDQIRECRTYASYVTQELKRKKESFKVQRRKPGPYKKAPSTSNRKTKTTKRSRLG